MPTPKGPIALSRDKAQGQPRPRRRRAARAPVFATVHVEQTPAMLVAVYLLRVRLGLSMAVQIRSLTWAATAEASTLVQSHPKRL
jgi:hypothetical protein